LNLQGLGPGTVDGWFMPGDAAYGFALIAVAAWIALIYVVKFRPGRSWPASRPRRYYRTRFRPEKGLAIDLRTPGRERMLVPDFTDPGQQLNAVMAAPFERRKLLNVSEHKVFKIIERDIWSARRGYRIFAQTSLGEILRSPDEQAFRSINSKRVDILIVDPDSWPVLAVEYQGSGHYQGTAAARDAVKKEALRKAGVGYVEVSENDDPAQIRARVRHELGWEDRPNPP
jgi:hypothetical protein